VIAGSDNLFSLALFSTAGRASVIECLALESITGVGIKTFAMFNVTVHGISSHLPAVVMVVMPSALADMCHRLSGARSGGRQSVPLLVEYRAICRLSLRLSPRLRNW